MNSTERIRQPWMHDMKPLVVAPAQLWETADGTVDASQQHAGGGQYRRILCGRYSYHLTHHSGCER